MYKLIAVDLDGTLLNSYSQVSEKNKQAIKNAKNKGIEVVLCSGRGFASVKSIANETEANNYAVCGNGALVYNIKNQKIMYNNFIENIKTKSLNYNVLFYHKKKKKKPDDQKTNINVVQDIYKYIKDREKEDYLKISICDEHNVIFNGIIRKLRTINKIDVLDVAHMSKKIIKTRNRRNGNKLLLYRNNESKCKQMASVGAFN